MKPLPLIALAVLARLLWRRQLVFEQDLIDAVSDLQVETLELVEQQLAPSNGSHR